MNMNYYSMIYPSPLGDLRITSNGTHILELVLPCQLSRYQGGDDCNDIPALHAARIWLDDYFSGKHPNPNELPIQTTGTDFQNTVWERLCRIPYGQTVTYGQIAKEIALARGIGKMSAQAVGQAVGANPIGIIIPCHRVVGSNGKLTGYNGGITNKSWLLEHERK